MDALDDDLPQRVATLKRLVLDGCFNIGDKGMTSMVRRCRDLNELSISVGAASLGLSVLCCAALCCAVLCCAVLCCAVLCCAVLCCAVVCTRFNVMHASFVWTPSNNKSSSPISH
jgi:hypothetical protein